MNLGGEGCDARRGDRIDYSTNEHGTVRAVDRHGNGRTYQFEYGHLHHTLIEIGRFILDHLDRNNFMCFHILTLDHLAKCPLAQNIKDQVSDRGTSVPT